MKKIYALAAAAALPLMMAARPASPELSRHVNPDGTIVEYRTFGDEHFHYFTDASGDQILDLDKEGRMAPMVRNGQILRATPTVLSDLAANFNGVPRMEMNVKGQRMAALDIQGRSTYPTKGDVPALVILLEFPDTPYTIANPVEQYTRFCNEEGYSDYDGRGSAKDYFHAISKGQFNPTFEVYGPVKLEHEHQWYVGQADALDPDGDDPTLRGYQHDARFGFAIKEALEALDDQIDFSRFDLDKDGNIDNIFFFYSGYGQADNTSRRDLLWPHQWDYWGYTAKNNSPLDLPQLIVDGVEMRTYACSNELNGSNAIPASKRPYMDGIGAFVHEYGHVLGLPDLYSTNGSNVKTPGNYSVMDHGSYNMNSTCPPLFSSYEMWVCNWLDYTDATDNTAYTVKPLSSDEPSAVRVRIRKAGSGYYPEYFLIECRDNTGWDEGLAEYGMMIWRINYQNSLWITNSVNNTTPHVELLNVPGTVNTFAWPGEDMDYTYIIPSQNVFLSATTGKTQNVTISGIDYDLWGDNVLTFRYNMDTQTSDAPVLSDQPTGNPSARTITLKWSAVEGATDYALTVTRTDSNNRTYTVSGLNETLIGSAATEYVVTNVDPLFWDQKFTAYVRAYTGVPATTTSNKITFIPNQLSTESSVEEISVEMEAIYGGVGCIHAPAGSKAYSLSGVETGLTNLPGGVYIVVTPQGATAKVSVR